MDTLLDSSLIHIRYVDRNFERPPKVRLFFDVMLVNNYPKQRWYLLPDNLGKTPTSGEYAIHSVDVYQLSGEGSAIVGHFGGSKGFQALLLPAAGQIHLRRFPILFWGEIPESIQIEIVVASQVIVGAKPASEWFGMNPVSGEHVDVLADALKDQSGVIITNHSTNLKEVSVTMEDKAFLNLQVNITLKDE